MPTILIVEDELLIAEEIAYLVRALGHKALEPVVSSDLALKMLAHHQVDLVLMDINIIGATDGIASAVLIRQQFAVPIVFMSAHSEATIRNRTQLAQPYGHIVKPVTEKALQTLLEAVFSGVVQAPAAPHTPMPPQGPTVPAAGPIEPIK